MVCFLKLELHVSLENDEVHRLTVKVLRHFMLLSQIVKSLLRCQLDAAGDVSFGNDQKVIIRYGAFRQSNVKAGVVCEI